jgi:TatD DNase family protein
MIIDTHAHLYAEEFHQDIANVIERARSEGIDRVLLPNIDTNSIEPLKALVASYPDYCIPMMGLHPCSVSTDYKSQLAIIEKELDTNDYVAVGEIGIDLYWDKTTLDIQKDAFIIQCQWAVDRKLPVAIHARDSIDILIKVLQEEVKGELTGVFHCFGGDIDQAKAIEELGFYLGIGGVVTFKNTKLRDVLVSVSIDRIMVETDAPYLAPVPYRGKRNESSYLKQIISTLAEVYSTTPAEISAITTANALKLFKI